MSNIIELPEKEFLNSRNIVGDISVTCDICNRKFKNPSIKYGVLVKVKNFMDNGLTTFRCNRCYRGR